MTLPQFNLSDFEVYILVKRLPNICFGIAACLQQKQGSNPSKTNLTALQRSGR